jgi:hypothetical protein
MSLLKLVEVFSFLRNSEVVFSDKDKSIRVVRDNTVLVEVKFHDGELYSLVKKLLENNK